MKNRMKTKSELGKISRFLRGIRHTSKGQSSNRRGLRQALGVQKKYPSSTKVGAGNAYRYRRQGMNIKKRFERQKSM
ncbi:MAG: hypothetical protein ABIJ40_03500 [Bacteroidota bacterium]